MSSSIEDDYVIKVLYDTGEVLICNSEDELLRRLNTQDHPYVLIALEIVRLRKRVAELSRYCPGEPHLWIEGCDECQRCDAVRGAELEAREPK